MELGRLGKVWEKREQVHPLAVIGYGFSFQLLALLIFCHLSARLVLNPGLDCG